jgi:hypothetical protein
MALALKDVSSRNEVVLTPKERINIWAAITTTQKSNNPFLRSIIAAHLLALTAAVHFQPQCEPQPENNDRPTLEN